MADQRITQATVLTDPTTSTQQAGVDASGQLKVVEENSANIETAVQLLDDVVFTDDAAFTPGTSKVTMIGASADMTTPDSVDEGDAGALRMTLNRNLLVTIRDAAGNERGLNVDASGQIAVTVASIAAGNNNIGDVDVASLPALPAGTNNIGDVDIASIAAGDNNIGNVDIASGPTGSSALEVQGTAADGAAAVGDPVQVGGKDGSGNIQALTTDTDGHLQVDVLSGGGVDTPTNPTRAQVTSSVLAAGSSANLDSADLPSKYLWQVDIGASVPWKAVLSLNDNGSLTTVTTLFGQAGQTVCWRPPHRAFAQAPAAGTGTQGWRVAITNLDSADAADVYAAYHYADN